MSHTSVKQKCYNCIGEYNEYDAKPYLLTPCSHRVCAKCLSDFTAGDNDYRCPGCSELVDSIAIDRRLLGRILEKEWRKWDKILIKTDKLIELLKENQNNETTEWIKLIEDELERIDQNIENFHAVRDSFDLAETCKRSNELKIEIDQMLRYFIEEIKDADEPDNLRNSRLPLLFVCFYLFIYICQFYHNDCDKWTVEICFQWFLKHYNGFKLIVFWCFFHTLLVALIDKLCTWCGFHTSLLIKIVGVLVFAFLYHLVRPIICILYNSLINEIFFVNHRGFVKGNEIFDFDYGYVSGKF